MADHLSQLYVYIYISKLELQYDSLQSNAFHLLSRVGNDIITTAVLYSSIQCECYFC